MDECDICCLRFNPDPFLSPAPDRGVLELSSSSSSSILSRAAEGFTCCCYVMLFNESILIISLSIYMEFRLYQVKKVVGDDPWSIIWGHGIPPWWYGKYAWRHCWLWNSFCLLRSVSCQAFSLPRRVTVHRPTSKDLGWRGHGITRIFLEPCQECLCQLWYY